MAQQPAVLEIENKRYANKEMQDRLYAIAYAMRLQGKVESEIRAELRRLYRRVPARYITKAIEKLHAQ